MMPGRSGKRDRNESGSIEGTKAIKKLNIFLEESE